MSSEDEDLEPLLTRKALTEAYRRLSLSTSHRALLTYLEGDIEAAEKKWALSDKLSAISRVLLASNSRSSKIYQRDRQHLQNDADISIPGAPGATYGDLSAYLPKQAPS